MIGASSKNFELCLVYSYESEPALLVERNSEVCKQRSIKYQVKVCTGQCVLLCYRIYDHVRSGTIDIECLKIKPLIT